MKTERCREWRESLGAYVLGHLDADERAGLEAHLEGCPGCQAEVASLQSVATLLPHADPARFGPAPQPPKDLGERIFASLGSERRERRQRRRLRFGLAFGGAATALAIAALALVVFSGGSSGGEPEQHVKFTALPKGVKIGAVLEPHAYGTEIRMYVSGVRSGTLCRVFLRAADGTRYSAGSFRYRWGDDSDAILSSALDLSRTAAIGVHAGNKTFIAPVDRSAAAIKIEPEEDAT